jgi:hypothetical protein
MRNKSSAIWAILLIFAWQTAAVHTVEGKTRSAAAMTWYAKWELNGNDWKVVFLIPSSVRKNGFRVCSNRRTENLVVSRSTFVREWYGGGWDKVTMTTGFRARLRFGYETLPYSNLNLKTFAKSLRIYH